MRPRRHRPILLIASIALTALLLTSRLPAQEPFDYFQNSWNIIGLKDYDRGTRITPDNRLILSDGEARIQLRQGPRTAQPEADQDALRRLDADRPALRRGRPGAL